VFVAPTASRLAAPHHAIDDGDRLALTDSLALEALATPGHTPDHHAYLLHRDGRPAALFSRGSLMVGTIGRTDLCGPELTEPLAHQMFHSLRRFDDLLAAVSDVAHLSWRARSVGIYRLWSDAGFAVGALLAGILADLVSPTAAIWAVAALTAGSGLVVLVRMYETHPHPTR